VLYSAEASEAKVVQAASDVKFKLGGEVNDPKEEFATKSLLTVLNSRGIALGFNG
jgi:hypothetical protein